MIASEITPYHEALLMRFRQAQRDVALDGQFDLPAVDRAVC